MYCRKCGKKIEGKMKFCPVCGAEISKTTEKNTIESSRDTVKQKKNGKRKVGIVVFIGLALIIVGLIAAFLILKQRKEKMFDSNLAAGDKYLEKLDMLLVMTVEPGFGGQKYIPESTERIRQVRHMAQELQTKLDIEVDGGITADNVHVVLEAGANVVVAGSAVFRGNIKENVEKFMAQF